MNNWKLSMNKSVIKVGFVGHMGSYQEIEIKFESFKVTITNGDMF